MHRLLALLLVLAACKGSSPDGSDPNTTDDTSGDQGDDDDDTTTEDRPYDSLSWSPVGEDGWTQYEPHEDTQLIHVSSSSGSDDNDGLTPETAVQTVARAIAIASERSQGATIARPDWILFRSGDEWTENFAFRSDTIKGGLSVEFPFLLTSYGDGPRPKFTWAEGGPAWSYGWWGGGWPTGDDAPAYWSIVGLEFYASTKDPNSPDFDADRIYDGSNPPNVMFQREGHHILVEDCKFQYSALVFQSEWPHHVAVRRSLFLDNYGYHDHFLTDSVYEHSQGLYMNEVDEVLLEENLFDHNGWLSEGADYPTTAPTIFNHNVYLNSDTTNVVVHRNITSRSSADGIKGRGGGQLLNNLGLQCGIAFNLNGYSLPDIPQTARHNVVLDSHNMDLHGQPQYSGHAPRDWGIVFGLIDESMLETEGNIVAHSPTGNAPISSQCEGIAACADGFIVHNWGSYPDTPGSFPEPERNLEGYMESLGETPTFEAFIAEARRQSRANWRPRYTADAVNDWIREGFAVTEP